MLKALAKAPGDRYSDLRALDEALLAARAHEGELRRVTQILALDPAFWDEDGSRGVKAPSAPLRAAADPTPLATFAADLKANQPELAAAVFNRHDPRLAAPREPFASPLRLSQLALPVTAPSCRPSRSRPSRSHNHSPSTPSRRRRAAPTTACFAPSACRLSPPPCC